ncbi:MAG: TIM barrel protein [bacterium]
MPFENLSRRRFLESSTLGISGVTMSLAIGTQCRTTGKTGSRNAQTALRDRLFILDTWFWKNRLSIPEQNEMLKTIGLPRVSDCRGKWETFPELLATLDREGIELVAVYAPLDIDSGELPEYVNNFMEQLKGRDTLVWFNLTSKEYGRSDPAGDDVALRLMRQAADATQQAGVQISIYPHAGCWAERAADAYRVAVKTQSDNVGCTFNLYHWLKVEGPDNFEEKAKAVLPKLNCITINGTQKNASELKVEEGILPLGEGDYDVEAFVKTFVGLGYTEPIGLQGYGIGGDIQAKLEKSLDEWGKYCANINSR